MECFIRKYPLTQLLSCIKIRLLDNVHSDLRDETKLIVSFVLSSAFYYKGEIGMYYFMGIIAIGLLLYLFYELFWGDRK